ncbi:MAG: ATP phosphoribosyltransferase, partial [Anaerolineae bacterium]|nr:ATP phosphoribosyltransferase [Anaerolineae bacterium]
PQWYTITIIIQSKQLLQAVEHLRAIGGTQVIASPVRYVFMENSPTFAQLTQTLNHT